MSIPEQNLRNMLASISRLNHVLNETITIIIKTSSDCPNCSYDPIRHESTDPYCDLCDGTGIVVYPSNISIPASVETVDDTDFEYNNAGRLQDGQIYVTIDKAEIDTVLNPNQEYDMNDFASIKKLVESFDEIVWKGARYGVVSYQPQYLQGIFYELSLLLERRQ